MIPFALPVMDSSADKICSSSSLTANPSARPRERGVEGLRWSIVVALRFENDADGIFCSASSNCSGQKHGEFKDGRSGWGVFEKEAR